MSGDMMAVWGAIGMTLVIFVVGWSLWKLAEIDRRLGYLERHGHAPKTPPKPTGRPLADPSRQAR